MKRLAALTVCLFTAAASLFAPRGLSEDLSSVEKVVQGNTQFAVDLYRRLGADDGNLFFSPYSISAAFAMTYAGARSETAGQMAAVLHFSPAAGQLHPAFGEIQAQLEAIQQKQQVVLSIANSLWPADEHPFLADYLDLVRKHYRAEITPVDYRNDSETARLKINAWIEQKTGSRIKDIIPKRQPPFLLPGTRLTLVNAIYFKGAWAGRFDKSYTQSMAFHLKEDAAVEVPMMFQETAVNYGEDEAVQVLEMPYAGHEVSMLIVLPKRIDGLREVEDALTVQRLEQWIKSLSMRSVRVYVPRLRITFSVDLMEALKQMGMPDAFDQERADFSGMDGNRKPPRIYLYAALHKAFVEVDEEGTEAAAATVVSGCFPAGTEVHTENGLRAIESLEPETRVYACDLVTGKWTLAKVLKRQSYDYQGDMITVHIGDQSIRSTGNQPFYVLRGERLSQRPVPSEVAKKEPAASGNGRWVEARNLKEGDVLKSRSGDGLVVTGLSSRQERSLVYGLDIDPHHNCAVHRLGVVTHNSGKKEGTPMFQANHPFLFLIRETVNGSVLFMGRVTDPR